jgi:D-glycero-D-manno-heptose 1,7-bisphosphate phosphatase
MNKAVFLDRDGTVVEHVHYLKNADDVRLVSKCAEALKLARNAGYLLIVISNQSIVGRGTGTSAEVNACNARMRDLLRAEGVELDLVLFCPHTSEDGCGCRKPRPGMLVKAAEDLAIDLAESVMIGDNVTDMEAGENAGCRLNLYLNTREARDDRACFDTLLSAVEYSLSSC